MDRTLLVLSYFESAPVNDAEHVIRIAQRILRGRTAEPMPVPKPRGGQQRDDSIPALATRILREADEPMSVAALEMAVIRLGKRPKNGVVRATLGKMARKGDTFCKAGNGMYGLNEWACGETEPPLDQSGGPAQT